MCIIFVKQKELLTLKTKQHETTKQRSSLFSHHCRLILFCSHYSLTLKFKHMVNITIHNAISGITSPLVHTISMVELIYKTDEDKKRYIQNEVDRSNLSEKTKLYEMFEINKCLLIYYGLTHIITIKFEL